MWLVPLCINQSLDSVLGPIVTVQFWLPPLYRMYKARASAFVAVPSGTVSVSVDALAKVLAEYPKASPISSKFMLVVTPQVPDFSPVPISSSLRSFSNVLAMS